MTTTETITGATRDFGLEGRSLCVHSSLRSFGLVEGGANAVVEGLLSAGCTLLVPTFSSTYAMSPPTHLRPDRNGWDYERVGPSADACGVYSPDALDIDADMGAIPAAVVHMPGRQRGNHPLCSFSAVGPLAAVLIPVQTPRDVFAPLRRLVAEDGWVVLMGVGLEAMTLLHVAEQQAGRRMFMRWAKGPGGSVIPVEAGGCSRGFPNLEAVVASSGRYLTVGDSAWAAYPATALLAAATEAIRSDPEITRCSADCERCEDAIAGGPRWS